MSTVRNKNTLVYALCAGMALLSLLLVYGTGLMNTFRTQNYDLMFLMRGEILPPEEIVIVAIDEPSFANMGIQWPWPRQVHASLIDSLTAAGARTIGLDILFPENSSPAGDAVLKEALLRHGNVILASDIEVLNEENYQQVLRIMPAPDLSDPSLNVGFVNLPLDFDGTIRRANNRDEEQFAFSWLVAEKFHNDNCCNDLNVLIPQSQQLNFYGPPRHLETVSYYQALDAEYFLPDGFFQDKLVLVGLSVQSAVNVESGNADYFLYPFSTFDIGMISGVELQATATANFLDDSFVSQVSAPLIGFLSLLFTALALVLTLKSKPIVAVAGLLIVAAGGFWISVLLFSDNALFFPVTDLMAAPVLAFGFSFLGQFYLHYSDKKFVRQLFESYVAPEILKILEEDVSALQLGGKEVKATILFMDIMGFTTLSEQIKPNKLIEVLNVILGEVAECIIRHDGVVSDYIGDAVMGVWGSPLESQDHADKACKAAIEICRIVDKLNQTLDLSSPINIRVGVNTGKVISGNVGSEQKMKFTVMGDPVNLASRLEGINNFYKTKIIISKETVDALQHKFILRELDDIRVKGKKNAVKIFELSNTELGESLVDRYHQGKNAYQNNEWDKAAEIFKEILQEFPEDGPSATLLTRCHEYMQVPPESNWQGVHTFTEK